MRDILDEIGNVLMSASTNDAEKIKRIAALIAQHEDTPEPRVEDPRTRPLHPDRIYYCVALGDLAEGHRFFGPFAEDQANCYAEHIEQVWPGRTSEVIALAEAAKLNTGHEFFPWGKYGYVVDPARGPLEDVKERSAEFQLQRALQKVIANPTLRIDDVLTPAELRAMKYIVDHT